MGSPFGRLEFLIPDLWWPTASTILKISGKFKKEKVSFEFLQRINAKNIKETKRKITEIVKERHWLGLPDPLARFACHGRQTEPIGLLTFMHSLQRIVGIFKIFFDAVLYLKSWGICRIFYFVCILILGGTVRWDVWAIKVLARFIHPMSIFLVVDTISCKF